MSIYLSQNLKERVLEMPEYRQGTNKVLVKLRDGRVYKSVFIAWGNEIIKVGIQDNIPFEAEDVVSVENDL